MRVSTITAVLLALIMFRESFYPQPIVVLGSEKTESDDPVANAQRLDELREGLRSKDKYDRARAAKWAGSMGEAAAPVVADLIALHEDSRDVFMGSDSEGRERRTTPRRQAIDALIAIGKPAVPQVLAALQSEDSRTFAARVLSDIADPRTADALLPLLRDATENNGIRALAAKGLGRGNDARAIDSLVSVVLDGKEPLEVREAAAKGLRYVNNPKAVRALMTILTNKRQDDRMRRSAAYSLAALKDKESLETLKRVFFDKDEDRYVRMAALTGVQNIDKDLGLKVLKVAIEDPDWRVRGLAYYHIAVLDLPNSFDLCLKGVEETEINARKLAILALPEISDPRAVDMLISLVTDAQQHVGRDRYARHYAAVALALSKDPRAVPWLFGALRHENEYVRREVWIAIERVLPQPQHKDKAELWRQVLLDRVPNARVRFMAIEAMGMYIEDGNIDVLEPLIVSLQDEKDINRQISAYELGRTGDPRAIGPLKTLLKDEEEVVRKTAKKALDRIEERNKK